MSTGAVEPALDSVLRLCDGCAHGVLSRRAVGVGRRTGNARLPLQSLAQLIIGLSHMLAQNVPAGGLVLAEVARGKIRHAHLNPSARGRRSRTRVLRGGGR